MTKPSLLFTAIALALIAPSFPAVAKIYGLPPNHFAMDLPKGWITSPKSNGVLAYSKGAESVIEVQVRPSLGASIGEIAKKACKYFDGVTSEGSGDHWVVKGVYRGMVSHVSIDRFDESHYLVVYLGGEERKVMDKAVESLRIRPDLDGEPEGVQDDRLDEEDAPDPLGVAEWELPVPRH
ncbi:MAG: hypothetical protein K6A65_00925 [Succinivibrionaceae bacterium]|nr:hypothetical protein [Succinivibrionaceae bacterium]